MRFQQLTRNGFSLVELSIVLVILGLLTGGILAGQSLIRAAELRSISSQYSKYLTAIHGFRDKYLALPGDMRNAVRFWGAQAGGTADGRDSTCAGLDQTSPATGLPTCNGNGNGRVSDYEGNGGTTKYESFRAWQHLANAGLVEGTFSGVTNGSSSSMTTPGTNVPASKISGAGFNLTYFGNNPDSSFLYAGSYEHVIVFGAPGGYHGMGYGAAILAEEAWNIDTKMDDGKPAYGAIVVPLYGNTGGMTNSSSLCANSATAASADYSISNSTIRCALIFKTGF